MVDSKKIAQVRSARQVPAYVRLLDDEVFNTGIDKRAVGWILFDKVCEHLNILEKDYFGLTYIDPTGIKYWLNNDKKIAKQLKAQKWELNFEVKFYPPDPAQLAEDLTRYQLCLQIRRDIVNEKLPCSFVTYTLLGSYTAQSEIGDYDPEEFGSGYKYLKEIQFAPRQDKDLLTKIAELHRQHKGQTPEEAELHFLENAKKLAMYGVELHSAWDAEGKEISIGVSATGLTVYKDKQQINRFVWPKVLKISYRRNKYYIKIRPGEFETFASLIGFKLANVKAAKRLWKISVEHHSFFRFREPEAQKSVSILPRFGSRFRYSGRTQFQSRQLVHEENRDCPYFERVMSKRGTFAGRTTNMRKRDEERQQLRNQKRRQPPPGSTPESAPRPEPTKAHSEPKHPPPPLPSQAPPEPKRAPPIAPKPKSRGSMDSLDKVDKPDIYNSLNASFDDNIDRRSRLEKMHAVATPLAAMVAKQHDDMKKRDAESLHSSHGPPGYESDDPEDRQEVESRPITPEVIYQDEAPARVQPPPMTEKEKKLFAKQEKERLKREKEEEKRRKKEEEKERKRLEKEKKALLAEEKKAASKMSKKGNNPMREPSPQRKDSKNSSEIGLAHDIGRDWENVREQDIHGPVTPDRTRKRLSSFEDIKSKTSSFKKREVDKEREDDDRPPTPPEPLPTGSALQKDRFHSGSSEYDSEEEKPKKHGARDDYDDEEEEVSF